ncbi:MAG: WYL domain-containing protein [Oscillospiraceae bacterium]|nr:WYL domain-containing protein [Oscillospiraceae bacterium]
MSEKKGRSAEGNSSPIQTITEIWSALSQYASAEKPLKISEIAKILNQQAKKDPENPHASGKTAKRYLPDQIDAINTLVPQTVVCEAGEPTVLHTYGEGETLHVVVEDPEGAVLRDGVATVVLKPGGVNPISEKTLNRKLPTLMEQFDALQPQPPLSLAGLKQKNGKYVPALEHEEEKSGRSSTRAYYLKSLLSDAEWRIFYDLVRVYPYISEKQTAKYLSVLQRIAPAAQKRGGERYARKTDAAVQFRHIRLLDQAIEEQKQVALVYGRYQLKRDGSGKLRPRLQPMTDFRNTDRPYVNVVEPYAMMWSNGYYYLVGKTEGRMQNFRLDRVMEVQLLSGSFTVDEDFDPIRYRDRSPVMYPGEAVYIRMRCPVSLLSTVVDFFSSAIKDYTTPAPLPDGSSKQKYTEVSLTASEKGVKLFALQYADQVEVLEPQSLRDAVAQSLRSALAKYE